MSWYSVPDWLTGYDAANADAAAKADAKRLELDAAAAAAGKITADEYTRRLTSGSYGVNQDDQRAEIDQAFGDSVVDNAKSISSGVANTLSFTVWRILSAVPPVVWLLAALWLFIYMGGGVWMKGIINRKK